MERKILQVALNEDQRALIDVMIKITGTKVSTLVRGMLLEWAARVLNTKGAVRNGECAVHCAGVCVNEAASWYNTANRAFLCERCARHLNERYPVCVPATSEHQPALDVAKMRALAEELSARGSREKTEDELLDDLKRAAEAWSLKRAENAKKGNNSGSGNGFDRVLERFAVEE